MFRVPRRLENLFGKKLLSVFQRLINRVTKSKEPVEKTLRDFVFSKEADEFIDNAVEDMINEQRIDSAKSWRDASRRQAIAREIFAYTKNEMSGSVGQRVAELVSENSSYIKSLPSHWADRASELAFKMTLQGKRPEEIEAKLREEIPASMQKNLKTIARTEAAKSNAAIAQARAEDLGISCYIWRTCNDERVRPSHQRMNGVLCFWDTPPAPEGDDEYNPGGTYNCRCYAEPVINIKSLSRTVKVWDNGGIKTLSKRHIMKMDRKRR